VSRRKRRPGEGTGAGGRGAPRGAEPAARGDRATGGASTPRGGQAASAGGVDAPGAPRATSRRLATDIAVLAAVFAVTAGIAELAGAANLGVALGVGQVAFAIALVVLLLRA